MSDEKRYLEELSHQLDEYAARVRKIPSGGDHEKLHQLLQEILVVEKNLRESCGIGTRFNVIRTQLQSLLKRFEEEIAGTQGGDQEGYQAKRKLSEDEIFVYVYLFNTQGANLKTWQKLLLQDALAEHTINRPIYANKEEIMQVLRAKPNKVQHAYLEIAVNKRDIIPYTRLKDQYGFNLLRLKQNALKVESICVFFYNDKEYRFVNGDFVTV
jgi:intracellular multiplication protein IcmQ